MLVQKTYKMKMTQKRTCKGCRSLTVGINGTAVKRCELGYNTKTVDIYGNGWITETKPLEPCPKPTTNMLAIEASEYYMKGEIK